jgi:hypothetical protein
MSINRAPFNALVDDDGSNTVGTVWNKNQIKTVLLDPIDALPGVTGLWTPYVPGWGGNDGIGPGMGNGIITGRYQQIGKWIDVAIVLRMGTTTSYGTSGYWFLSLPFPTATFGGPPQEVSLRVGAMSAAGAVQGAMTAYSLGSSVYMVTSSGALVNATTPFAWTANSILSVRGSYELT